MSKANTSQVTSIAEKDWLDLAWKHFMQHAQQRIQYFNYFVVFSTILTTGIVTTFQQNFQAPYLGIGLGFIQSFLSFIFWKIDARNRFLTKHAEDVIKKIENTCCSVVEYRLFTLEANKTAEQNKADKGKLFFIRQFSHGKSYNIIYMIFFIIGIAGVCVSCANSFARKYSRPGNNHKGVSIGVINIEKEENKPLLIDTFKKESIDSLSIIVKDT